MTINEHSKRIELEWSKDKIVRNNKRSDLSRDKTIERKNEEAWEIAEILKDRENVHQNDRARQEQQRKDKTREETGSFDKAREEKSKSEILQDKETKRQRDIANGNRATTEQALKKSKGRMSRREYRKVLVNADKDFGIRKKSDPLGMARAGKKEMQAVPDKVLFTFDLDKVPSSRRRRLKAVRVNKLRGLDKSNLLRKKSDIFIGRGKKAKMDKISTRGYSKKDRAMIDRLRGITKNSPTKARASKRSISNTSAFKKKRGGR